MTMTAETARPELRCESCGAEFPHCGCGVHAPAHMPEYVQYWECPSCGLKVKAVFTLLDAEPGNQFPWNYSGGYGVTDFDCENCSPSEEEDEDD